MGLSKTKSFGTRENQIAEFAKALAHPARIASSWGCTTRARGRTVMSDPTALDAVLGAISFSHFLNDTMQSLLPALYLLAGTVWAAIVAYDGDTLMEFVKRTGGEFEAIYAFELDRANFEAMRGVVDGLAPRLQKKIKQDKNVVAKVLNLA